MITPRIPLRKAEPDSRCVIRRAGPGDFELIRSHYAMTHAAHTAGMPQIFRPMDGMDFPHAYFVGYLEDENTLMLVAELDGFAAGSIFASIRASSGANGYRADRTMHISNVATHPEMRRRGVARALVGAAAEWAASKGVANVELIVWSFNETAIALYRSLGLTSTFTGMTVPASELVARLGSGRLPPAPPPPSWLARLLRR